MDMKPQELIDTITARMRYHAQEMTGSDQADGFIIVGLVRILSNLMDSLSTADNSDDLSGPRLGLLIRLLDEDRRGGEGLTPTILSHNQHVSRNTISALLRGLEEQELISREIDPHDRRLFRIHITPAGRKRVSELAPGWINQANHLTESLSAEESRQLIHLLSKLFVSMHEQGHCPEQIHGQDQVHQPEQEAQNLS